MDKKARLLVARTKMMEILNKKQMKDLVGNLVESVIPTSIARKVIDDIINESVYTGRINIIVDELENNDKLRVR